jgi:hypothetical protein
METVHINKPSVLRVPVNVWHCPIRMELRKPVMFQATYLDGTWSKILRRMKEDGVYEYIYEGDNVRKCILEPGKPCVICGKCYEGISDGSLQKEGVK